MWSYSELSNRPPCWVLISARAENGACSKGLGLFFYYKSNIYSISEKCRKVKMEKNHFTDDSKFMQSKFRV